LSKKIYNLALADDTLWSIQARDDEAAKIVDQLGTVMRLQAGQDQGRKLHVVVDSQSPEAGKIPFTQDQNPLVCVLSPPESKDMLYIQMMYLSLAIARDAQARGGLLLHGALTEWNGKGVILAGSGNAGKTTACRRLQPPWRSLCDDTTLIIREKEGKYWAHPWPTWSTFYQEGPGSSWDVQQAVPLHAVFFLSQSPQDRVEPLNRAQAASMLLTSTQHVSRSMTRKHADEEVQVLLQEQMAAVEGLVRAVPAYGLHNSLTGKFWEEIEPMLKDSPAPAAEARFPKQDPRPAPNLITYTGPSMNSTLREGDLLEVVPYNRRAVKKGDIIYFQRKKERAVVHRVVRVTKEGIQTRGDNNSADDPYILGKKEIIGQVVAAQRSQHRRASPGGQPGLFLMHINRLRRAFLHQGTRLLSGLYQSLAKKGTAQGFLPKKFRPQVVSFQTSRYQELYKLMVNGKEVGRYDDRNDEWRILRPFRLFVDENELPQPKIHKPPMILRP